MHLKPMLDVCTDLNSACAAADVILGATDKSDTLIAAVKEQLQKTVRQDGELLSSLAFWRFDWFRLTHFRVG
jgi:hypothetical protein